jgi:hypothetical protein
LKELAHLYDLAVWDGDPRPVVVNLCETVAQQFFFFL